MAKKIGTTQIQHVEVFLPVKPTEILGRIPKGPLNVSQVMAQDFTAINVMARPKTPPFRMELWKRKTIPKNLSLTPDPRKTVEHVHKGGRSGPSPTEQHKSNPWM
jgi:hypothetical protein